MYTKKVSAKGLKPPRPRADHHALEKLPQDASSEQLKSAAVNISLADLEERVADVQDQWEESSLFEDALDELTDETATTADGSKAPPPFGFACVEPS
jgi:hypothetical protein